MVASVFTRHHGRHPGMVNRKGSRSGVLGTVTWTARLEGQLGRFSIEVLRDYAFPCFGDPARLAALASVSALLDAGVPERSPEETLFDETLKMLGLLAADAPDWPESLVWFELFLLAALGHGLDLSACGASGARTDLLYVSPRTGRAVSGRAGAPWREYLLPLPVFLAGGRGGTPARDPATGILWGLQLTGHFLRRRLFSPLSMQLPAQRQALEAFWSQRRTRLP